MNGRFVRLLTVAATLSLSLAASQNLRAQAPPPPQAPPVVTTAPSATELLSQAYVALATADHDYDGHRLAAIKSVKAAAKELGVTLKEKGHDEHERQRTSDEQLRAAQGLLQQASTAGLPPKVEIHIQKAIEHINSALSVK